MSINVTVSGNPVSIHRGRMVLSDLDQIKKNERDRRRRLRLEQVRQQSKEISNRLLERAKNVTKTQLTRLEKDGKSELKQMHEQKIMDLQRKYQEDMEDIGRAHASASLQPNLQAMVEADRRRNRFTAAERGKDAMQRLKEANKMDDPQSVQHDRLRQVREVENVRASMVANLPKKSSPKKRTEQDSDSSEEDETHRRTAKRKKYKKAIKKKSPAKVVVKSPDLEVIVSRQHPKSRFEPQPGPSGMQTRRQPDSVSDFVSTKTVNDIADLPRNVTCESDDQEPRKFVPSVNTTTKADKVARYNPQDYKQDSLSSSSSGTPSSLSDDSSYFSDGGGEQGASKKTPRHPTSLAGSKVQVYDHNTRQRNAYNRPAGLVERVNIRSEPNAEDLARQVLELESIESRLEKSRKINAQRRGNDAILRDRVRRDYQTLLQNLDHLSREERKLRASQIHGPPCKDINMDHAHRKELQAKRQRDMAFAFERILHDSSPSPQAVVDDKPPKRIVTITPRAEDKDAEDSPHAVWQDSPFIQGSETTGEIHQDGENEQSREEQILDMLKKVERQKRLLLREFGADLPDNILNASLKPLFHTNLSETRSAQQSQPKRQDAPCCSPEIMVINMSSCDEREKKNTKKFKKKEPVLTRKIETAVQTSTLDEIGAAKDKGVQVEMVNGKPSSSSLTSEETVEKPKCYEDEPRVKIVTPEVSSGSSDSVVTSVVIDIGKKQVKVTPRKNKKSNLKLSKRKSPRLVVKPRSMPVSKTASPTKKPSKSAPPSRKSSPKKVITNLAGIKSPDKKIKVRIDKDKVKVVIDPHAAGNASKESSTETSQDHATPDTFETYRPYVKTSRERQVKMKDTSDTSTSYTSPPPILPATLYRPLSNTTPILEILETSSNESMISKGKRVSPVSSPETPSPRTIAIPTNALHPRLINKMLQYSTDSITTENRTSMLRSHEQSTPIQTSSIQQARQKSPKRITTPEICSCKNPSCKLLHARLEDIEDYALKNCPEILKKYEDLQNMCTNRIASLTDLIEKVRNEQKGMEFSVVAPSDESSLLLVPGPTPMRSDMHSVRKLVDSIEAIHNQLAKTLNESQRIIASEEKQSSSLSTLSPETSSKSRRSNTQTTSTDSSLDTGHPPVNRMKPKIISDETVRLAPDHLRALIRPQTVVRMKIAESTPQSQSKSPEQEEDMVKKLSNEILEQSKSLEKSIPRESPQDLDQSSIRRRIPSPQFPAVSSGAQTSQKQESDASYKQTPKTMRDAPAKDTPGSPEGLQPKKDNDFVPLLAGIPKVPRAPPIAPAMTNRGKPPVSLIHGPYRQVIETPVHELSTIVEFDTPDAVNRSQGSVRSPAGKSKKSSITSHPSTTAQSAKSPVHVGRGPEREPTLTTGGTTIPKSPPKEPVSPSQNESSSAQRSTQIAAKKSPVHVAPVPLQKTTQTTVKKPTVHGMTSQTDKSRLETVGEPVAFEAATTTSSSPGKPKTSTDTGAASKDDSTVSNSTLPDISDEMLKRDLVFHAQNSTKNSFDREDQPQPISPASADPNKEKITSTSSNSFSGLSGISEITSTPTSDVLKYASSPEEMEAALKKLGLGWAITTLKKTREASALSSSSNSDITPVNTARKIISPVKKQLETNISGLPDLSDVSSISIKDASKSTERAVLLKGRTSTPNIENSNTSGEKSKSTTTSSSGASLQDPSDSIIAPNVSLTSKKKSYIKHMKGT